MSLSSVSSIQDKILEIESAQRALWDEIGEICVNTDLISTEISLLESIATDDIGTIRKSTSELATSIASAGQAALTAAAGVKELDFVKRRVAAAAALVDKLDTQLSALSGVRSSLDIGDLPAAVSHYCQLTRARAALSHSATHASTAHAPSTPSRVIANVDSLLGPIDAIEERRKELMAAVEAKAAEHAASGALSKHLQTAALLAPLGAPQTALRVMRPAVTAALVQVAREAVTHPWDALAATTGARAHVALLTQLRRVFDAVANVVSANEATFAAVTPLPPQAVQSQPTPGRGARGVGGAAADAEGPMACDGRAALGLAALRAATEPASEAIRALLRSHKSDTRLAPGDNAVGSEVDLATEETAQVAFACSVFFEYVASVICGEREAVAGEVECIAEDPSGLDKGVACDLNTSVTSIAATAQPRVSGGGQPDRPAAAAVPTAAQTVMPAAAIEALAEARKSELAGLVGGDLLWLGFVPLSRRHLDIAVTAIAALTSTSAVDAVDDVFYLARQTMLRACRTRCPAPIIDGLSYIADETVPRFVERRIAPVVAAALASINDLAVGGSAASGGVLTLASLQSTLAKGVGGVSLASIADAAVAPAVLDALHAVASIHDYAPRLAADVQDACVSEGVRDDLLQPPTVVAPDSVPLPSRLATRLGPFADQVKACLMRVVIDPWERTMVDVLRRSALEPVLQMLSATPFDATDAQYAKLDLSVGWTQAAEDHWAPLVLPLEELPELLRDRLVESLCRSLASAVEATVVRKRFNAMGGERFELDCRAVRSFWASAAPTSNLLPLFQRLRAMAGVLSVEHPDDANKDCLSSDDVRRLLLLRVDLQVR